MTILINDKPHEWAKARIKYTEVNKLGGYPFMGYIGTQVSYQINRGIITEHGYLTPGSSVRVREGMAFTVRVKQADKEC